MTMTNLNNGKNTAHQNKEMLNGVQVGRPSYGTEQRVHVQAKSCYSQKQVSQARIR